MGRIEPIAWSDADHDLWASIAAHDFEPAGDALTFTARLARDHDWSLAVARAAVEEYRRFCFLAVRADLPVTPSETVDEVWHQHLTFSRDYWQVWCPTVLGRPLHHQPTKGGVDENRRFAEQYARTLALYESRFGPPPPDVWPGTAERFGRRPLYRIVDTRRALVIPRPGLRAVAWIRSLLTLGLAAALSLLWADPAAAAALDVLDWTAGPFLDLYVVAAAASLVTAYAVPILLTSTPGRSVRRGPLKPVELGLLAGGRMRAADVLILEAIAQGDASVAGKTILIDGEPTTRASFMRDGRARLDVVRDHLADRGLALSAAREKLVRLATIGIAMPVVSLGVAKIIVGHGRDKPVGHLVFLVAVTLFITLAIMGARRPASREGRAAVRAFRAENARAIRAPRPAEVMTAFACVGAAALWGTEFEAYGELIKGSGDGGGCGGGGDGGGGGCGGCGD